jgi:mycofactocin system glycosyltransferase
MKGFRFTLAAGTSLTATAGGYFLVSRLPLRALRVNRPLFELLGRVHDGVEVETAGELLPLLLELTSKGYLELKSPHDLEKHPLVSIIVPVKNQPEDLADCLASLERLDWPPDRREIIVIDDGSTRPIEVPGNIKLLRNDLSVGPASCRNLGARQARGDILAFLDADCLAGKSWLLELVPFLAAGGMGAAGGYVAGHFKESFLDRYEDAFSPLNMGKRLMIEGRGPSTFYVPTANMLVKRDVFMSIGGFEEGQRVGEDVDLCWRLREAGYNLLYTPSGEVAHKHRNRPGRMLRRRAEYGTSEAGLYRAHPDKRKTFVVPVFAGLSFLALAAAILLFNPYPLIPIPLLAGLDAWRRAAALKKLDLKISAGRAAGSAIRGELSFHYFAFFHLVRYYLVALLALGFLWHPVWAFAGLALAVTSIVDFAVKKPRLPYPVFLFFYLLEHLFYQVGVFLGCLKAGSFGSYRLAFRRSQ